MVCWNGHFGQNWLWWPLASQEVSSSCMYSVKSTSNSGAGWRPTTVWSLCRIAQTLPTNWRRTSRVMWTQKSRMLWLCLCHRQVQIHCQLQRGPRLKLYQSDGTRGELLHRRISATPSHYKQKCFCAGGFFIFSFPLLTCLSWLGAKRKWEENNTWPGSQETEPAVGPGKVKNLREGVHKEWLVRASLPRGQTHDTPSSAEEIPEQTSIAMYASL